MTEQKKTNPLRSSSFIFMLVGAIMLVLVGTLKILNVKKLAECDKVDGYISDIVNVIGSDGDSRKCVFVSFEYNGQLYADVAINEYNSMMDIGDEYTVYIENPNNPREIATIIPLWVVIMAGAMGTIFFVIGVAIMRSSSSKMNSKLMETGMSVWASNASVIKANVRVNGFPTYRVSAEWTDETGKKHIYKSQLLSEMPTLNSSEVQVFVDKNNYKNYYMNTDFTESTERV